MGATTVAHVLPWNFVLHSSYRMLSARSPTVKPRRFRLDSTTVIIIFRMTNTLALLVEAGILGTRNILVF